MDPRTREADPVLCRNVYKQREGSMRHQNTKKRVSKNTKTGRFKIVKNLQLIGLMGVTITLSCQHCWLRL
jgi:hypothetical protein